MLYRSGKALPRLYDMVSSYSKRSPVSALRSSGTRTSMATSPYINEAPGGSLGHVITPQ